MNFRHRMRRDNPVHGVMRRTPSALAAAISDRSGIAAAAGIVAARTDRPFLSVDDLWRRAGAPSAALVQLAEADAFRPALRLARREALWAIKALRDEPLPLDTIKVKSRNFH